MSYLLGIAAGVVLTHMCGMLYIAFQKGPSWPTYRTKDLMKYNISVTAIKRDGNCGSVERCGLCPFRSPLSTVPCGEMFPKADQWLKDNPVPQGYVQARIDGKAADEPMAIVLQNNKCTAMPVACLSGLIGVVEIIEVV